jgi:hypothetical protein
MGRRMQVCVLFSFGSLVVRRYERVYEHGPSTWMHRVLGIPSGTASHNKAAPPASIDLRRDHRIAVHPWRATTEGLLHLLQSLLQCLVRGRKPFLNARNVYCQTNEDSLESLALNQFCFATWSKAVQNCKEELRCRRR